jgi:hypothetical protein
MGRIPKAEKERAIKNLNSEYEEDDEDDEEEEVGASVEKLVKQQTSKQIQNSDSVNSEGDEHAFEESMDDSIASELDTSHNNESTLKNHHVFYNSTHMTVTARDLSSVTNPSTLENDTSTAEFTGQEKENNLTLEEKHKGFLLSFLEVFEQKHRQQFSENSFK